MNLFPHPEGMDDAALVGRIKFLRSIWPDISDKVDIPKHIRGEFEWLYQERALRLFGRGMWTA